MACFIVPAAEAIIVSAVAYSLKKKEQKLDVPHVEGKPDFSEKVEKISRSRKLGWLSYLLWGGVFLLAFEHLWHGEIVPFPPFLTAMYNADDTRVMLLEMATVGPAMCAVVTSAWGLICAFADLKVKRLKAALAGKQ